MTKASFYGTIKNYIYDLQEDQISSARKSVLLPVIEYLNQKLKNQTGIFILFICTHNSRRSQFAEVWARTLADFYNFPEIRCFSGGMEVTAVHPTVARILEKTGFKVTSAEEKTNPKYQIKFSEDVGPLYIFSKKFSTVKTPSEFLAVMTCDHANESCPIIPNAQKRLALTYTDPKVFDGTLDEEKAYLETSKKIATEMKYIFSHLNRENGY